MRRFLIVAVGAVSGVAFAQIATAADLPIKMPLYEPSSVVADNWTGFYVGGSLGWRWADSTWNTTAIGDPAGPVDPTTTPASFNSSAFRVGGYFGYNSQIGPWVVGLEADVAWAQKSATQAGIPGTFGTGGQGVDLGAMAVDSSSVKLKWDGSVRARLGYLVAPTWLIYATGGFAWQQADINATCNGSLINSSWCLAVRDETASITATGWTVGGGVETLLGRNWLLRAEYRYSDYGHTNHTFFETTDQCTVIPGTQCDRVDMSLSLRTNTALVGLAYKF